MENINLTEGVHFKIKCSYVLENPIKLKDVTIKENLLSETNKSLFIDSLTMKNIFIINN